jgi:diadenosine tetraphosphate (Ap4A) HIT family hydrolase
MDTEHCDFCNEFSGKRENAFDRIYAGQPRSRILYRSDSFVVIPSMGQIVEGYLLVVPVRHWTALGDIPSLFVEELTSICERIRTALRQEYGSCIFFEHGTRSKIAGGCGIYHSHLHAVPCPEVLEPTISLISRFPSVEFENLQDVKKLTEGLTSYLFYQNSQGKSRILYPDRLTSQYMRRLLGELLGNLQWDWRIAGREERLLATLNRLSNYFESPRFPLELHVCK